MKIALTHVDLPNQSKGGVAYQVHRLANVLTERGHDVTLFSFSPAFEDCRYRVHRYLRAPRLRQFDSFVFAWRLAHTNFSGFDVLHTNGDNYGLRGFNRSRRPPQLRTFYGSARDEAAAAQSLQRRLYQMLLIGLEASGARHSDLNVGISRATQEKLPRVAQVVPCGVDLAQFQPGCKTAQPTILFVGTTGGRKRGALLAEVFRREVRPQFPDTELWSVAEAPMQGAGIVNCGHVSNDELAALYRRAWVFCLPSTYEGFGVPYIEAMASGTPVVATPNAGAREVLGEGDFGVLAADAHLGKAIVSLLRHAEQRQELAHRGLARAQEFDWNRVARQYEELYEQLVRARRDACEAARHSTDEEEHPHGR